MRGDRHDRYELYREQTVSRKRESATSRSELLVILTSESTTSGEQTNSNDGEETQCLVCFASMFVFVEVVDDPNVLISSLFRGPEKLHSSVRNDLHNAKEP
jgi:hypothetical protein